ncbi:hypothetical protein JCM30471_22290 [Desulfuromonas carbonis]
MKSIFTSFAVAAVLMVLTSGTPALAAHPDTRAEIDNLKQRIEALENGRKTEQAEEPPFSLAAAGRQLIFSGLLELEGNYTKEDGGDDRSDLTLSTLQFSTEVFVNEQIGGHVILLYEEEPGEDALRVDEAVIGLHCPKSFLGQTPAFYGGRLYLPFGRFNSAMVSDPLTLELGESSDSAAVFALEGALLNLSLGVFNGGTDAAGAKDHIDSLVAALEVTPLENLAFGVSWISDLAESDNQLVADPMLYSDSVPGAAAYVSATSGPLGLNAEILGALADFDTALVGLSDLTGNRPLAWNLEASWQATDDLQFAARYEQARDFQDNVKRYSISGSYGLFADTALALEYLHANPDTDPDNDTVTAQLAWKF